MPTFIVKAQVTQDLELELQADSLEEAEQIAERDLITDDFGATHAVFTLGSVMEVRAK